ncbi:MAG TPA: hypothetical protein VKR31_10100 [Rhizomicrobium sp.]|nr:hypothetical protein [Rhizomicrobium sp.]
MPNWIEIALLAIGAVGTLGNFVISLMIAVQIGAVKVWAQEKFVAKTDFMDLLQLLGTAPGRKRP